MIFVVVWTHKYESAQMFCNKGTLSKPLTVHQHKTEILFQQGKHFDHTATIYIMIKDKHYLP